MSIVMWPTSVQNSQAFQTGLRHLVDLKRIPNDLNLNPHPLPIYNFGLRDVLTNADPGTAAKLVSWRYFASGGAQQAAVSGDVNASVPRVTRLSYGAPVLELLAAIDELAKLPGLAAGSYEPRLLQIPGLLIEAFWLKPLSGQETGWVVPYHTRLKDADKAQPVAIKEFFRKLVPLAEKALAGKNSPAPLRMSLN